MGASGSVLSPCCCADADQFHAESPRSPYESPRKAYESVLDRLIMGLDITLILQDKSRLLCQIRYDPCATSPTAASSRSSSVTNNSPSVLPRRGGALVLTSEKKMRVIGIDEVKQFLYSANQLARVDKSAGITAGDLNTVVALHLLASGNCIPLFFSSPEDKAYFVSAMKHLLPSRRTKRSTINSEGDNHALELPPQSAQKGQQFDYSALGDGNNGGGTEGRKRDVVLSKKAVAA